MNGMTLKQMDNVLDPVYKLRRDHKKAGLVEGIKVGISLATELAQKPSSLFFIYISKPPVCVTTHTDGFSQKSIVLLTDKNISTPILGLPFVAVFVFL